MSVSVGTISAILDLEDRMSSKLKNAGGSVEALAGKIKNVLTIGAIIGAVKSFGDFAGGIDDMSKRLNIGTDAVQKLSFAAQQNGADMGTVAASMDFLARKLADGDDSTVGALKQLGLNFNAVRAMSMDEAFIAVGNAVSGIEDPMLRAQLRTELLGRGAGRLQSMLQNLNEEMAKAPRLTEDQVKAGDKLGDSFDSLITSGKILIGALLTPLAPKMETAANATASFTNALNAINATASAQKYGVIAGALGVYNDLVEKAAQGALKHAEKLAVSTRAVNVGDGALKKLTMSATDFKYAEDAMDEAVKKSIESTKKATEENDKLAVGYRAITNWIEEMRIEQHGKQMSALTEEYRELAGLMASGFIPAIGDVDRLNRAFAQTVERVDALKKEWYELQGLMASGTIANVGPLPPALANEIENAGKKIGELDKSLASLGRGFEMLANVAGDSMGRVVRDIGSVIAAFSLGSQGAKTMTDTMASMKSGEMGTTQGLANMAGGAMAAAGGFMQVTEHGGTAMKTLKGAAYGAKVGGQMFGVFGGIVGAAAGALAGFFRGVFGGGEGAKVNNVRDEWIKAIAGTSDNLREMMGAAGATDAQIRKLFDSKNLKDFEAAQKIINDLLGEQKGKSEEAARAQEEAARIAAGTFSALTNTVSIYQAKLGNTDAIRKFEKELREVQTGGTADLRVLFGEFEHLKASIGNTPEIQTLEEALMHAADTGVFEFDKFKDVLDLLGSQFGVTYDKMRQKTFELTAAQHALQAEFQKTLIAGRTTAPNNNDLLSPAAFRTFEDWRASWLSRNQGEEHRVKSALGGEWQAHWGPRPPGFAHGGIVTTPTLGMVGEAGPEAIIPIDELVGMIRDLPRAIKRAVMDGMVLAR